jgi:flagellar assembly protein FliH
MAEGPADTGPANDAPATDATPPAEASAAEPPAAAAQARLAAIEREAFEKGFAAGERAGTEAGAQRAEGILRRLGETLDELGGLRRVVLERSERDLVRLALAIARRVIGREIQMDPEYVAALTHVALDRLAGQEAPATVRVNPDDYQKLEGRLAARAGGGVRLVADATVRRGGCLIESEFGSIDASVDAQLDELSRGLLGESHARDPRAA